MIKNVKSIHISFGSYHVQNLNTSCTSIQITKGWYHCIFLWAANTVTKTNLVLIYCLNVKRHYRIGLLHKTLRKRNVVRLMLGQHTYRNSSRNAEVSAIQSNSTNIWNMWSETILRENYERVFWISEVFWIHILCLHQLYCNYQK